MNKYISIAIVVIIIIFGVWLFMRGNKAENAVINPEPSPEVQTAQTENKENINNVDNTKKMTKETTEATLKTNMGSITFEFYAKDAPNTVVNFEKLAKEGFYNGTRFHRVIKGFMIQSGDPQSKDDSKASLWGTGGPGYKFADEINAQSDLYTKTGYKKGIVAMANSGPNTNGSQFFIMTEDYPLPPLYTIFGRVTSGQDVVDKIALVKTGANDRPVDPVTIESITLK
ncbi:MAG TPA: peptidylprolyl isomerase [Candidatus Paceibacterota bacterium]|jgi:cyclophilin family peptidyl-prolyl cis-trans isomerase|nr:peptidylprolyl isomerase [Candidatus Paceibacterota bacterium]